MAEAVVRELAEETALEGVCGELIGIAELFDGDEHLVICDYDVTVLEAVDPRAGSDAAEAAWVPLADAADLALAPGMAEFLHDHGILATIT